MPGGLRFRRAARGCQVQLGTGAMAVFDRFRQLGRDSKEAGGILIGRLIENCNDVVIDAVTVPCTEDRRGRFSFFRARRPAQKRVVKAWSESGQTQNYLGEWHTHPEDDPTPSARDLKNWRHILKHSAIECDALFFVIVGRVTIRVWEGSKATGTIEEVVLTTSEDETPE